MFEKALAILDGLLTGPAKVNPAETGGRTWYRTTDLYHVKVALSH